MSLNASAAEFTPGQGHAATTTADLPSKHLEYQVDKDIDESIKFLSKDGFIILHDCNPPSEFHQRENYEINGKFPGMVLHGNHLQN